MHSNIFTFSLTATLKQWSKTFAEMKDAQNNQNTDTVVNIPQRKFELINKNNRDHLEQKRCLFWSKVKKVEGGYSVNESLPLFSETQIHILEVTHCPSPYTFFSYSSKTLFNKSRKAGTFLILLCVSVGLSFKDLATETDFPLFVLTAFKKFFPIFKWNNFYGKALMNKGDEFVKPFEQFIGKNSPFKPSNAGDNWVGPFNTKEDLKISTNKVYFDEWKKSHN